MDYEFIDENDIDSVKRGRKSSAPKDLIEMLSTLTAGKACKLNKFAGDPADEGYENYKSNTGAMIRSAAKQAGVTVRVSWSPLGVPQVRLLKPSGKRK